MERSTAEGGMNVPWVIDVGSRIGEEKEFNNGVSFKSLQTQLFQS